MTESASARVVLVGCHGSDDGGKDEAAGTSPRSDAPGGSNDALFIGADIDGHFTVTAEPVVARAVVARAVVART